MTSATSEVSSETFTFITPKKVNRRVVDAMIKITNYPSITKQKSGDSYIVESMSYDNLFHAFKEKINSFRKELPEICKKLTDEKVSTSHIQTLEGVYINTVVEQSFRLGSNDEQVVVAGDAFVRECDRAQAVLLKIREIKRMLGHLRLNDNIYSENKVNLFSQLRNRSAEIREYEELYESIMNLIRKTYTDYLVGSQGISQQNDLCFIGTDSSDMSSVTILDKNSISEHEYGYIFEPEDFDRAYDDQSKDFKVYSEVDRRNLRVDLKNNKPSAIYVVTLGELEFSKNYSEANKLANEKELPVVQIDLTRFLNQDEVLPRVKELVDELLQDKFALTDEKQKPTDLSGIKDYSKFMYFFNEFQKLKLTNYAKDDIIQLFEHCYSLLYDSSALNLEEIVDYSFNHRRTEDFSNTAVAKIGLALNNNPYFDFNIFAKKGKITVEDVHNFISYFEKYCDESHGNQEIKEILEKIYPGINIDYIYLTKLSEEQIATFVGYVNQKGGIDSWYLSQEIQPHHRIKAKTLEVEEEVDAIEPEVTQEETVTEEKSEDKVSVRQLLKVCQEDLIKKEL